jgi:type II secretion system protein G
MIASMRLSTPTPSTVLALRTRLPTIGVWQRGFTLIELMVILVIIGVLAALIVPNVIDRADESRVTAARADVANLMQALKLYRLDNQRYPTQEQGLQALVQRPTSGPVDDVGHDQRRQHADDDQDHHQLNEREAALPHTDRR